MADDSVLYEIRDSPDTGGVGVFATKDIASGTRIWQEEALFISQKNTLLDILEQIDALEKSKPENFAQFKELGSLAHSIPVPKKHLTPQETLESGLYPKTSPKVTRGMALAAKAYLDCTEPVPATSQYDFAIASKRVFKAKYSSYTSASFDTTRTSIALSTFELNAFPACPRGDTTSKGIFLTASRLNHSCIPNCNPIWNYDTQKFCVYAVRNISAGEELRVMYDMKELKVFDRRSRMSILLLNDGFHCKCPACDETSDTSKRMDAIAAHFYRIRPYALTSSEDHGNKGLDGEYKKVLKLMDEDVSFDNWQKGMVHCFLLDLYQRWGDGDATHHGARAYELAVRCLGGDHPWTKQIDATWKGVATLAMHPW